MNTFIAHFCAHKLEQAISWPCAITKTKEFQNAVANGAKVIEIFNAFGFAVFRWERGKGRVL